MALPTPCQTNGAVFDTHISDVMMQITISFGKQIELTEDEAVELEVNVHNMIEIVLSKYYKK